MRRGACPPHFFCVATQNWACFGTFFVQLLFFAFFEFEWVFDSGCIWAYFLQPNEWTTSTKWINIQFSGIKRMFIQLLEKIYIQMNKHSVGNWTNTWRKLSWSQKTANQSRHTTPPRCMTNGSRRHSLDIHGNSVSHVNDAGVGILLRRFS